MREDIEFDADGVTLRGWFYRPDDVSGEVPCIIMTARIFVHQGDGSRALRRGVQRRGVCLRGLRPPGFRRLGRGAGQAAAGDRPVGPDPRLPARDHLRAGPSRRRRLADRGVGLELLGRQRFVVAAIDRRVKAVCGQVPAVAGRRTFETNVPKEFWQAAWDGQAADRLARARGEAPAMIPVVTADPTAPAVMPTPDAYEFFSAYEGTAWRNEVTLRSTELGGYEAGEFLKFVAPTPLLMVIAEDDNVVTPGEWAKEAFDTAAEPKRLVSIPGGHFDAYTGHPFELSSGAARDWFLEHLAQKVAPAPV